jgi:hypothetical protein
VGGTVKHPEPEVRPLPQLEKLDELKRFLGVFDNRVQMRR